MIYIIYKIYYRLVQQSPFKYDRRIIGHQHIADCQQIVDVTVSGGVRHPVSQAFCRVSHYASFDIVIQSRVPFGNDMIFFSQPLCQTGNIQLVEIIIRILHLSSPVGGSQEDQLFSS